MSNRESGRDEGVTRRRFLKVGATAVGTLVIGGGAVTVAAQGPETELPHIRMGDGDMKTLVVYGTKSGCTTGIAEKIGETLAANGISVEVVSAEEAESASGYDAVVVGSGVRVGQWHAPARQWVEANAETLKGMPVAFYTCCLTMTEPGKADEVRAYTDALIESTGVQPVDIGLFAGWMVPEKFSFLERTIMKVMKAPEGDKRDWAAVQEWAESITPRLGAS